MKKKKKEKPVLSAQEQWNNKIKAFFPEAERYANRRSPMGRRAKVGKAADMWTHNFHQEMNRLTWLAGIRVP